LKQYKKANFEPSNINKCNILRLALKKQVEGLQRIAETWFAYTILAVPIFVRMFGLWVLTSKTQENTLRF